MKTLADIKRRAVTGTRLEVVAQTVRPELVGTVRTIIQVHSARYRFTSSHTGGQVNWGDWPKASQARIIDADTFEYDIPQGPGVIRLRFLPA